MNNSQYTLSDN